MDLLAVDPGSTVAEDVKDEIMSGHVEDATTEKTNVEDYYQVSEGEMLLHWKGKVDIQGENRDEYSIVRRIKGESDINHQSSDITDEQIKICQVCDTLMTTEEILKRHMVDIHNFKDWKGNLDESVKREVYFEESRDLVHICQLCTYSCDQANKLKIHIKRHTGEKKYLCEQCNYSCSQVGNLRRHMVTHTGEKIYNCQLCTYSSSLAGSLRRHMLTHTGEKSFICKLCNFSCSQAGRLKRHIDTHTGEKTYICQQCAHSFSRADNLKTHMMTHTGEKSYNCQLCTYSSSLAGTFRRHITTHNGEKPYKCPQCTKTFSRGFSLRSHMQVHNRAESQKPATVD